MASRKIKKELLEAFPMFYFRVRRHGESHRIDVVKGPVDFNQKAERRYVSVVAGEGRFVSAERFSDDLEITTDGSHLLALMGRHVMDKLSDVSELEIALGTVNTEYEITHETDCTVLINNPDGSKSYRGYDFKRPPGSTNWQLYYNDLIVTYNNDMAISPEYIGFVVSRPNITDMKAYIDTICGKPYDDRAATIAKLVSSRHLFAILHPSKWKWKYRECYIKIDSAGQPVSYDENEHLIARTKNLKNALICIDNYLKKT